MGFKDLTQKLPDKEILDKVPGLDAATKKAEEKMTDMKEEVIEKTKTSTEKIGDKVEDLIKH